MAQPAPKRPRVEDDSSAAVRTAFGSLIETFKTAQTDSAATLLSAIAMIQHDKKELEESRAKFRANLMADVNDAKAKLVAAVAQARASPPPAVVLSPQASPRTPQSGARVVPAIAMPTGAAVRESLSALLISAKMDAKSIAKKAQDVLNARLAETKQVLQTSAVELAAGLRRGASGLALPAINRVQQLLSAFKAESTQAASVLLTRLQEERLALIANLNTSERLPEGLLRWMYAPENKSMVYTPLDGVPNEAPAAGISPELVGGGGMARRAPPTEVSWQLMRELLSGVYAHLASLQIVVAKTLGIPRRDVYRIFVFMANRLRARGSPAVRLDDDKENAAMTNADEPLHRIAYDEVSSLVSMLKFNTESKLPKDASMELKDAHTAYFRALQTATQYALQLVTRHAEIGRKLFQPTNIIDPNATANSWYASITSAVAPLQVEYLGKLENALETLGSQVDKRFDVWNKASEAALSIFCGRLNAAWARLVQSNAPADQKTADELKQVIMSSLQNVATLSAAAIEQKDFKALLPAQQALISATVQRAADDVPRIVESKTWKAFLRALAAKVDAFFAKSRINNNNSGADLKTTLPDAANDVDVILAASALSNWDLYLERCQRLFDAAVAELDPDKRARSVDAIHALAKEWFEKHAALADDTRLNRSNHSLGPLESKTIEALRTRLEGSDAAFKDDTKQLQGALLTLNIIRARFERIGMPLPVSAADAKVVDAKDPFTAIFSILENVQRTFLTTDIPGVLKVAIAWPKLLLDKFTVFFNDANAIAYSERVSEQMIGYIARIVSPDVRPDSFTAANLLALAVACSSVNGYLAKTFTETFPVYGALGTIEPVEIKNHVEDIFALAVFLRTTPRFGDEEKDNPRKLADLARASKALLPYLQETLRAFQDVAPETKKISEVTAVAARICKAIAEISIPGSDGKLEKPNNVALLQKHAEELLQFYTEFHGKTGALALGGRTQALELMARSQRLRDDLVRTGDELLSAVLAAVPKTRQRWYAKFQHDEKTDDVQRTLDFLKHLSQHMDKAVAGAVATTTGSSGTGSGNKYDAFSELEIMAVNPRNLHQLLAFYPLVSGGYLSASSSTKIFPIWDECVLLAFHVASHVRVSVIRLLTVLTFVEPTDDAANLRMSGVFSTVDLYKPTDEARAILQPMDAEQTWRAIAVEKKVPDPTQVLFSPKLTGSLNNIFRLLRVNYSALGDCSYFTPLNCVYYAAVSSDARRLDFLADLGMLIALDMLLGFETNVSNPHDDDTTGIGQRNSRNTSAKTRVAIAAQAGARKGELETEINTFFVRQIPTWARWALATPDVATT